MLQLPFGITSIKKLYDNTEKGEGGYYPFGSHNFWHSGIHIHTESTNVFEAVLPGTVIAYRIAQKYEMFPLPTMILDDEAKARYKKHLELYNSEEAEFAETIESSKNNGVTEYRTVKRTIYRLKGDLPDEKKKIEKATGFILLEHEYKIKDLEKKSTPVQGIYQEFHYP